MQFKGKVVLLAIGGSWCPNCQDEAPFLVDLYKEFHPQGLEIVGLMFEADADPALARPHVQTFIRRYGIPYPMLLAGTPDDITKKIPQLVNFGAYPTTIYLGRDNAACTKACMRGLPARPRAKEYVRLKGEVRAIVQRLLAENAQAGRVGFPRVIACSEGLPKCICFPGVCCSCSPASFSLDSRSFQELRRNRSR